ncbi:bile acid:sodium symporter family protein [Streptomyces sp. NPDC002574]|uniref:bile acid:sodium symporter family protein n=1 Tax=Streptomyces sp. NPDC002574 TaxID=3364652 RepID=UPI0036BD5980
MPAPTQPAPRVPAATWLRRHLGRAVAAAYAAAVIVPEPGRWLRRAHGLPLGGQALRLETPGALLCLILFAAGLQVPLRTLGSRLRRPVALLTGVALHLAAPLLVIPVVAFVLHRSPDTDGGSGMIAAMILITAMPVAAGATVWTARGHGDQAVMVGIVLASTLVSPVTVPMTIKALSPLLRGDYVGALSRAAHAAGDGFALTTVLLPCLAGILSAVLLPVPALRRLSDTVLPALLAGSVVLTYVNASGALGSFLTHPRPVLLAAALTVASAVCGLSFTLGRVSARLLRLDRPAQSSFTLACGMSNSSAGAVLISTALPDRPHLLLPVLAYGLLQKLAADRVMRARPPRAP